MTITTTKISLNVKCENISIEKALPIGLIITRTVSATGTHTHAIQKDRY